MLSNRLFRLARTCLHLNIELLRVGLTTPRISPLKGIRISGKLFKSHNGAKGLFSNISVRSTDELNSNWSCLVFSFAVTRLGNHRVGE